MVYKANATATPETYYYVLNLQGDVVKLITASGVTAAEYTYNAWGEIITATGSMAEINPLRYRGYYYDAETGFYYLQSRYYDPAVKRFINADSYASTDATDAISYNMFAYCNNNPVMYVDPLGTKQTVVEEDNEDGQHVELPGGVTLTVWLDTTSSMYPSGNSVIFDVDDSGNVKLHLRTSKGGVKPISIGYMIIDRDSDYGSIILTIGNESRRLGFGSEAKASHINWIYDVTYNDFTVFHINIRANIGSWKKFTYSFWHAAADARADFLPGSVSSLSQYAWATMATK